MYAWLRSLPLVALCAALVGPGCSSVTDFDRFHGEDGGSARDSSMDGNTGVDAGPCEDPVTEICNGEDDDCDGMVDEEFDLDNDPANCGSCGRDCPEVDHSMPGCAGGECAAACDDGWGDCDDDYITGCETDLTGPDDCTACGTVCEPGTFCSASGCVSDCPGGEEVCGRTCVDTTSDPTRCGDCDTVCDAPPHSSPICDGGACSYVCDEGWKDCDTTDPSDGCETDLTTVDDCGDCDVVCSFPNATPACTDGVCEYACNSGYEDCNGEPGDGCEADLGSTTTCADCSVTCTDPDHASGLCDVTGCGFVCDSGWEDCNGEPGDGCEADLSSATTCGDCGTSCSGGTPVCSSGTCVSGCSGDTPTLCSGSCVDTDTNPLHCGACDSPCTAPGHATATCSSATCMFACDTGWENCNGDPSDGCERSLTTASDCGGCDVACTVAHGTPTCGTGSCAIASCDTGWDDCTGGVSNGCETNITTTSNCGACGNICSVAHGTPGCSGGGCVVASCASGYGDCNGLYSDGCERLLDTYYRDGDGDGYGDDTATLKDCSAPSGYVNTPGDCDDSRPLVNPGASEACNGFDDDCDGTIDEGFACSPGDAASCTMTMSGCTYVGTRSCNATCDWGSCMPPSEVCNATDDNCNGYVDEYQLTGPMAFRVNDGTIDSGPHIAYSPDLEQFGIVTVSGVSGSRKLVFVGVDLSGTVVTTMTLENSTQSYQADIAWDGTEWVIPFVQGVSGASWTGYVGVLDAAGGYTRGSLPTRKSGTLGPVLPRVDAANDGSGRVGIVWKEDMDVGGSYSYVRFAVYSGTAQLLWRDLENTTVSLYPPVITGTGSNEFAMAWGRSGGGGATTRYTRSDTTGTSYAVQTLHTDGDREQNHEIAYDADVNHVLLTWTNIDGGGTASAQWAHGPPGSFAGTKLALLPSDRALPAWAADGAFTIAYGSLGASGAVRRFRESDIMAVPGDVTLAPGQTADIASIPGGSPRHAIVYPSGGDTYVRFIECM